MGNKIPLTLSLAVILNAVFFHVLMAAPVPVKKMAIFNFQPLALDASALGTDVTNRLITAFVSDPNLFVLDRKELEAFLQLNEMTQNDNLDNVTTIGSRLALDAVVVGTVEKKGSVIIINCKVINVEQKKVFFSQQVRSLGEARMGAELGDLTKAIKAAMAGMALQAPEEAAFKGPINVQKRPGNKRIQLNWEHAANTLPAAYEIFRAANENGPFAKVGQVTLPEYVDQNLENKIVYYYKIRAYNERGLPSEYSDIISAETALTPNAPVLLKADSHVKSVLLTWTHSPISSNDPLRMKGYKLYRSKSEQGPYREVVNIAGKDGDLGSDTASLDKLFKMTYTDKGLADGETAYYKITAYNEKNLESDFSTLIKGAAVGIVSDVSAQGDMIREIRLSWTSVGLPEIKGYYIYRSEQETQGYARIKKVESEAAEMGKKISYKDTEGLKDQVRYYYKITAFESDDLETSPTSFVSAQTKGKPPAPEGIKAMSGLVKKVEIQWNACNAEDVDGYNLYASNSKEGEFALVKKLAGRSTTKCIDEERNSAPLEDNGTYYYRMTSYNKVGVESSSVLVWASTKPRPAKPLALQGEGMKVKEIPLSWKSNPEADIACYHIFRANAEGDNFSRVAKVEGKTSYVDRELKDGTMYRYKLQAEDRSGLFSDYSEVMTVQTKPRPKVPRAVTGEIRTGKVNLKWERGSEPDIAYYTVYEKKFFGNEKIVSTQESLFTEPAPAKGKSKNYVLTSTDKDGLESDPCPEVVILGK